MTYGFYPIRILAPEHRLRPQLLLMFRAMPKAPCSLNVSRAPHVVYPIVADPPCRRHFQLSPTVPAENAGRADARRWWHRPSSASPVHSHRHPAGTGPAVKEPPHQDALYPDDRTGAVPHHGAVHGLASCCRCLCPAGLRWIAFLRALNGFTIFWRSAYTAEVIRARCRPSATVSIERRSVRSVSATGSRRCFIGPAARAQASSFQALSSASSGWSRTPRLYPIIGLLDLLDAI